jgi:hypothetical protein
MEDKGNQKSNAEDEADSAALLEIEKRRLAKMKVPCYFYFASNFRRMCERLDLN